MLNASLFVLPAHAQKIALHCHYKRVVTTFDFRLEGHTSKKEGEKINNGWLVCSSVKKCYFLAFTAVSGSFLLRKAGQTLMLTGKHSEYLCSWERSRSWVFFFAVSFVADKECLSHAYSFCFLASMELILIPNCSLLYLHSNNTNSLKSVFMKKSFSYKYNCYKNHK